MECIEVIMIMKYKAFAEIQASEKWVFKNKKVLKKLEKGLKDAEEGRLSNRGSFAKFIVANIEK